MSKKELIEIIKVTVDNRNEYKRALGQEITWFIDADLEKNSIEELKEILTSIKKQENYFRKVWDNR